jgi:hypothetical protein
MHLILCDSDVLCVLEISPTSRLTKIFTGMQIAVGSVDYGTGLRRGAQAARAAWIRPLPRASSAAVFGRVERPTPSGDIDLEPGSP